MPRRVAKTSRSSNAPGAGAVSVVSGSIRTADDATALDVKISIWDTEVTMRADGSELGHWPTHAVAINPIDAFTFEFTAEGDRLVFTPDNPDEFKQHPIVAGPSNSKRKRRGKKAESDQASTGSELRWDEDSQAEVELRRRRTKAKKEKEPRPSRQERKAAARQEKEAAAAAASARANQTPVVDYDTPKPKPPKPSRQERKASRQAEPVAQAQTVIDEFDAPAVERPAKERKPRRESKPKPRREDKPKPRREGKPEPDTNGHSRFADLRHRAWISSLDFARQYDLFGLDRVPVYLEQRDDPDHLHTWSHRVAPASGPGSFICTVCGAFKKRGA